MFAYYVLSNVFMSDLMSFIQICIDYNDDFIKLDNKTSSTKRFMKLLNECYKMDEENSNELNMHKRSLRMSSIDIEFS